MFVNKRDFVIPESGLDVVEKVNIGGVEHSIVIQAYEPHKPVLLFIHGGPCMPVPGVVSRGQDYAVAISTKELVKHFVVVFYDQRGAGKSFHKDIPRESIRVNQYIEDCNELISLLLKQFNQKKIYLAAHSWGTVIGLSIATRYPEKLHAYVGISQIVNWAENDQFCYSWLKEKAADKGDKKTLRKLNELGQPPYVESTKQWIGFRSPLMKYNSMIYKSDTVEHPGMIGGMKMFLRSSDYSFKDIYHTFTSAYKLTYTQELIQDFAEVDFTPITQLNIPVHFIHGKRDLHVDGAPVEQLYSQLNAPLGKKFIWMEKSSHMFHPEDAKEIEQYVINLQQPYDRLEKLS